DRGNTRHRARGRGGHARLAGLRIDGSGFRGGAVGSDAGRAGGDGHADFHTVDRETGTVEGSRGHGRAGRLVGTQQVRGRAGDTERDGLVGIRTDLELRRGKAAVEDVLAVELRAQTVALNFGEQLGRLGVERRAVRGRVRAVGGLDRQFADTLQ